MPGSANFGEPDQKIYTREVQRLSLSLADARKKGLDTTAAELLTIDEGLCAQIMHLGPYDDEPATVALLDAFVAEQGLANDMSDTAEGRHHHEIYLSDPRRTAPEKLKTVLRHPVRPRG